MVDRPQADVRTVDAAYFGTLAIPLLRGELFQEGEHRSVAVVSAALADRAWPGERALGKRFRLTFRPQTVLEVVGVVGDVRNMGLETRPTATVYLPHWQVALSGASFVVKTASDPITVATAARVAMSDLDDDVPIDAVRTMQTVVGDSVATRSFQAGLLSLFGAIALALSGIAVFGVMSYAVAQRARELGLRLALGATPRSLQRMIVGQTLRLVGTGVALGAPLAVLAGYLLRDVLFGVRPQDIRTLLFSVTVIVLVALVAGWLPARRAARNNPIATLRAQ
jgi:hypothetical protein